MSDPRHDVRHEETGRRHTYHIDNSSITYDRTQVGGSAQAGLAVTLTGNDTVALAGDGEAIEGQLILVDEDNLCVVQVSGYQTLPGGDGATLTPGHQIVGDLGPSSAKGYIRAVNPAVAAELGVCRGRIINASDATAVMVDL